MEDIFGPGFGDEGMMTMSYQVEEGVRAQTKELTNSLSLIKDELWLLRKYVERLRLETRITNKDLSVVLTAPKV